MKAKIKHVVIDEGSNQIKACWLEDGKIKTDVFPSRVVNRARMGSGETRMLSTYGIGAQKYTVAPRMDGALSTDVPEAYQVSLCNRVLVHESLRRNGFGGCSVDITTTLPVSLFYIEDLKNESLIREKADNLTCDRIENLAGEDLATVKSCSVKPEAIPAYYDVILDDCGNMVVDIDEKYKIMIVDIGGTTTDISVIDGIGNIIEFQSIEGGVFQIGNELKTTLIRETDFTHLEVYEIEDCLKEKTFNGQDITNHVSDACETTINDIITVMKKLFRDGKRLNAVLYVGGGADLIGDALHARYDGTQLKGDQFSIARGILKSKIYNEEITLDSE